jgi:cation diffusion facilitator CzcD-associated flavoprotein CzcO
VPEIAMSFSDCRFAYGPFAPHHIPRQYIENYFALHKTDVLLELNTTVEDVAKIEHASNNGSSQWKLTLRKHDALQDADLWWEETFDAVILANGHYSVPTVSTLTSSLLQWMLTISDSQCQGSRRVH